MPGKSFHSPTPLPPTQRQRRPRLIESDSFPFEFVSELAEMESWRKEVYRPVYHIHKWWAKRLGSVFRAMILGSVLPEGEELAKAFYQRHDLQKVTVFDPFMGSGTTVGEAHKLGGIALGRDINPVAVQAVRVALGPLDRDALLQAFSQLSSGVGERLRQLYVTADDRGQFSDALYYFWVKTVPCPFCSVPADLFSAYIFARNAYPDHRPEVQVCCPRCLEVFASNIRSEQVDCPHCRHRFNPHRGPAERAKATCSNCHHSFAIAKAVQALGAPPKHRLFAKLILTCGGDKLYLPATTKDEAAYRRCSEELARSNLPLPSLALRDGHNTRQAMNYCYRNWRDFFNDRQLLALGLLHQAILDLPDRTVREAVLMVFSGTLEFNNLFTSYKGEGTGAIRHMFSHHILKPERVPIEGNVWGTSKSSGSFSTLFKLRLLRAMDYRAAPFEVAVHHANGSATGRKVFDASAPFTGCVYPDWPPPTEPPNRAIYLSCGSSHQTGLRAKSVDLVITDPPFFDNVHYSELADFFYAWQQFGPATAGLPPSSTRHPDEVQDVDASDFAKKLQAVFVESGRVLKDDGLLAFSYHHSRAEGWFAVAEAVLKSGFSFVNAHPVKAEMSVAAPKSQAKEPIQLDIILVCRLEAWNERPRQEAAEAFAAAVCRARQKTARLRAKGFELSANDRRVVVISQFLVNISAGRTARQVQECLNSSLTGLEAAAIELLRSETDALAHSPATPENTLPAGQLVLLDRHASCATQNGITKPQNRRQQTRLGSKPSSRS